MSNDMMDGGQYQEGKQSAIEAKSQEPIDWTKDTDEDIAKKIAARDSDAKQLHEKKLKQYRLNEAYFDGTQDSVDNSRPKTIYNYVFPIIRSMTGLVTDVKPRPAAKVVSISEDTDQVEVEEYLKNADKLEKSLDEWWEDNHLQSKFQRLMLSVFVYDDFFVMPFWNPNNKDADIHFVHPRHLKIDPNADEVGDAEYAIVDLFKSRKWMSENFDADSLKDVTYMDYVEASVQETADAENSEYKLLKNVAKVQLYMEPEWFVYKCCGKVLKKFRNPLWAPDTATQKKEDEQRIRSKYEKPGIMGTVGKVVDKVKGAVGLPNQTDQMEQEISDALEAIQPSENYLPTAKVPLVQFDTYRLAGEQFSRSVMKQAIPTIDDMNKRKVAISRNAESLGEPTVFLSGAHVSEEQASKMKTRSDRPVRIPTKSGTNIRDVMYIQQGTPVPEQFFEDIQHDERSLDNLFGQHDVSRGSTTGENKTKGGILALQEADQTPVRFITRNLEDSFQNLFQWVVQIRKKYQKTVSIGRLADKEFLDYSMIDEHVQVAVKTGSMMPVSREQQRTEALDLYGRGALDPLSLYERLGDPHPEQTAKRLQAWITSKQLLTQESEDVQKRAIEQVQLISQNRFDEAGIQETDDPQVHHDVLVMALRMNRLSPEQEQFAVDLIRQYAQMSGKPIAPATNQAQPPVVAPSPQSNPQMPQVATQ